jgi:hypothetical protein
MPLLKVVLIPWLAFAPIVRADAIPVAARLEAACAEGDLAEAERVLARDRLLSRPWRIAWTARVAVLKGERAHLEDFPLRGAPAGALVMAAGAALAGLSDDPASMRLLEVAAALPADTPGVDGMRAWWTLLRDGRGWGRCGEGCEVGASLPMAVSMGLPLTRARVGGHEGVFIVDTGAATHALFRAWSRENGLEALPGTTFGVSSSGGGVGASLLRTELELGSMRFPDSPFVLLDSDVLPGVAGIVSPQFLAWEGRVRLDLAEGRLTLVGSGDADVATPRHSLIWEGGGAYVGVWLEEVRRGWFLVDTGASGTRVLPDYIGEALSNTGSPGLSRSAGGDVETRSLPGQHRLRLGSTRILLQGLSVLPRRDEEKGELRRDGILGLDALGGRSLEIGRRHGALCLDDAARSLPWPEGSHHRLHLLHRPGCDVEERILDVTAEGPLIESEWRCGGDEGRLRARIPFAQHESWMLTRRALEAWRADASGAWTSISPREYATGWSSLFVPFKVSGPPELHLVEVGERLCVEARMPADVQGRHGQFLSLDCPTLPFRTRRVELRDAEGQTLFGFLIEDPA